MTKSTKTLARWIPGLVVFEAVLVSIGYLMGDATTGPKFRFALFVLIVNLPGFIVASKLGFLGHGEWVSTGDPVLGGVVVVGVSILFYSACICYVHRALAKRRSECDPWKILKENDPGTGGGEAS